MVHIDSLFRTITDQLLKHSQEPQFIANEDLYRPANLKNRDLVEQVIEKLLLPGSGICGFENLVELHKRSMAGESCVMMLEHYSNFDIPNLFFLARDHPEGGKIFDEVVAMAGMKLNEESKFVLAFTEAYTRLVIYPPRGLAAFEGTDAYEREEARSREINRKALHRMIRLKHSGHIILLFPAGTRYRADKPGSKDILPQVDSYLRGFDHMVLVGIAGNTLEVNPNGEMEKDLPCQDVVTYRVSPVMPCSDFRERILSGSSASGEEARQLIARAVGTELDTLHRDAAAIREEALGRLAAKGVKPQRFTLSAD